MIECVNTEIVSYADTSLYSDIDITFDEAYPFRVLPLLYNGYLDSPYGSHYYSYSMLLAEGNNTLGSVGTLAETCPFLVGSKIVAFVLCQYDNNYYSVSDIVNSIGVCYYAVSPNNTPDTAYYKLTSSDIPNGIKSPFPNSSMAEGEDILWLYNFGSKLVSESVLFISFLDFNILGYNILSLLFTTGFMFYAGKVLLSWIF